METEEKIDISQYQNYSANEQSWVEAQGAVAEALQQLPEQEKAARAMLQLPNALPQDCRRAQEVLEALAEKRAALTKRLEAAKTLIATYRERLAVMEPEVKRQRDHENLAARLRAQM